MKQLNLNFDKKPITEPTKKEDFTQKDFEKYITTRPSFKESNGAFQRLVDQQNHLNKLEKLGIEESQVKHPNYPKKKPDVINYIDKMNEIYGNGKESAVPVFTVTLPLPDAPFCPLAPSEPS